MWVSLASVLIETISLILSVRTFWSHGKIKSNNQSKKFKKRNLLAVFEKLILRSMVTQKKPWRWFGK